MKADGMTVPRKTCTPIMDWLKADVFDIMARHKCRLPSTTSSWTLFRRALRALPGTDQAAVPQGLRDDSLLLPARRHRARPLPDGSQTCRPMTRSPNSKRSRARNTRCATDYDPLAKVQAKALSAGLTATHKEPEEEILPDREMENVEVDDKAEADRRPRSALKKSDQAVKDVSGELFHTTIVFLTEAQLKAFMQATGWVSVEHGRYVDGVILAERLGIKLPPARISSIRPGRPRSGRTTSA